MLQSTVNYDRVANIHTVYNELVSLINVYQLDLSANAILEIEQKIRDRLLLLSIEGLYYKLHNKSIVHETNVPEYNQKLQVFVEEICGFSLGVTY